MNKKITNDENIKNLKRRKILRIIIIIFSILTIITSLLSLFMNVSLLFPIIAFIITTLLMKYRDSIEINKKDDLKDVRKMLNKSKK